MKETIVFNLLSRIRSTPGLKRKLKVLAIVGVLAVFVSGGLVLWASVAAVRFASNHIADLRVPATLESVDAQLRSLPQTVAALSCWGEAQKMLNLQTWLHVPVADNFKQLRAACLASELRENPSTGEGKI